MYLELQPQCRSLLAFLGGTEWSLKVFFFLHKMYRHSSLEMTWQLAHLVQLMHCSLEEVPLPPIPTPEGCR